MENTEERKLAEKKEIPEEDLNDVSGGTDSSRMCSICGLYPRVDQYNGMCQICFSRYQHERTERFRVKHQPE